MYFLCNHSKKRIPNYLYLLQVKTCIHVFIGSMESFYQNKNHKIDPAEDIEFPPCPEGAINILANLEIVFLAIGLDNLGKIIGLVISVS